MFKGLTDLVSQAQKMREEMGKMQQTLAGRTVEVSSGGGMVKVVANGKQEILSVRIEPEVLEKKDKEMIESLVLSGVNEAIKASQKMVSEEMSRVAGALGPLNSLLQGMGSGG